MKREDFDDCNPVIFEINGDKLRGGIEHPLPPIFSNVGQIPEKSVKQKQTH